MCVRKVIDCNLSARPPWCTLILIMWLTTINIVFRVTYFLKLLNDVIIYFTSHF